MVPGYTGDTLIGSLGLCKSCFIKYMPNLYPRVFLCDGREPTLGGNYGALRLFGQTKPQRPCLGGVTSYPGPRTCFLVQARTIGMVHGGKWLGPWIHGGFRIHTGVSEFVFNTKPFLEELSLLEQVCVFQSDPTLMILVYIDATIPCWATLHEILQGCMYTLGLMKIGSRDLIPAVWYDILMWLAYKCPVHVIKRCWGQSHKFGIAVLAARDVLGKLSLSFACKMSVSSGDATPSVLEIQQNPQGPGRLFPTDSTQPPLTEHLEGNLTPPAFWGAIGKTGECIQW